MAALSHCSVEKLARIPKVAARELVNEAVSVQVHGISFARIASRQTPPEFG
jgi:hypothetical protein